MLDITVAGTQQPRAPLTRARETPCRPTLARDAIVGEPTFRVHIATPDTTQ